MANELPVWLNTNIVCVIQQLEESSFGKSLGVCNVQILLNVIDGRKLQLATVSHQGGERPKRRTAMVDLERGLRQWFGF